MAQPITANITSATTTTLDLPAGDHNFAITGTWGGTTANVRHAGSQLSFDGLNALTADPSNESIITTGGESVEIVTTGGTGINLDVSIRTNTPRRV